MPGSHKLTGFIVHGGPELARAAKQFPEDFNRALLAGGNLFARHVENEMKQNRPWTDRTSAAYNGLQCDAEIDEQGLHIVARNVAEHGKWLEIRYGGKWGIIAKTLMKEGPSLPKYVAAVTKAMGM